MLKYYIRGRDLLDRLRTDKDGVVSFEYVVVAGAVVAAVVAAFGAFGGGSTGALGSALTNGLNAIIKDLPTSGS
jgi:pilus assembly protein Flp/PilA